ncbi:MAG: asparagine synthetase B [Cyclobacteriaceae bacterium]|nr:asparagine synthetase B [Cyclobacteriaceae bacterium]
MRTLITILCILHLGFCQAASLLIPMDKLQKNHLKAYGIAFLALEQDMVVDWLLNYRGGSFLMEFSTGIESECVVRGVTYEIVSSAQSNTILRNISGPSANMHLVRMGRAPKIAVYSPRNELIEDDSDAVLLVLDYAEIPYEIIYDPEILDDQLVMFDWLHLHHEDFTGQVDKFNWRESARLENEMQIINAQRLGYASVPEMKRDVVQKIKIFLAGGGYLFAMCSGAETFDLALSAEELEINPFDYEILDPELNFKNTLAFENFILEQGYSRRYSDINVGGGFEEDLGYFNIFEFSAKTDIVPSILTQNHEQMIPEFFGRTTAFNKYTVKPTALILGENGENGNVRYIYGELGNGHWSYYSGHDPERRSYRGRNTSPTDLSLFPNSPGYRLILNNVLFPSTRKKRQKT